MKSFLSLLFGKRPQIFNKQGGVEHELEEKTWSAWSRRYSSEPQMNWRNHSGTKAKKSHQTL